MRRRVSPAQGVLFGRQYVHIGHPTCLMCKVLMAIAAVQECDDCPGWVEPAPLWAVLGAVEEPVELDLGAAA